MKRPQMTIFLLCMLSSVLLSIPWLVPHTGVLALAALVPLLCADAMSKQYGIKSFWPYAYCCFMVWNAITTFWVCNATVGGGIFAILANSFQMAVVWGLFRLVSRILQGVLPYIFLVVAWISWESSYFNVDISWPWLVLGHAFAGSTQLIQWYEYTGVLGGSLWIWLSNLGFFGLIVVLSDKTWLQWNKLARFFSCCSLFLIVLLPLVGSKLIYKNYEQRSEGKLDVVIAQPNIDPYNKFEKMTQREQDGVLISLFAEELKDTSAAVLLVAPETFTSDAVLRKDSLISQTSRNFHEFLQDWPKAEILYGAALRDLYDSYAPPSVLARKAGELWSASRNSAILQDAKVGYEIFHKSKLVVGTELTPCPKIFVPLDDKLSKLFKVHGLMGRCEGQDEVSLLHFRDYIPLGSAVCYESVYGDYCRDYVLKGAKALVVITNDAWWGNTPGYRQHLRFSALRAIELRRDIARCGNTGISCFIDQRGDILSKTEWWKSCVLSGSIDLNSSQTFYVRNGNVIGRLSYLILALLVVLNLVRSLLPKTPKVAKSPLTGG